LLQGNEVRDLADSLPSSVLYVAIEDARALSLGCEDAFGCSMGALRRELALRKFEVLSGHEDHREFFSS
jgi:hypothetical protein